MSKLTPLHIHIMTPLMALSLAFGPSFALAKGKTNSVTKNALNLDFNNSETNQEPKSDLDVFAEDSFLDAEFAASDLKTKRKKTKKVKSVSVAQLTDSDTANDVIAIIENPNREQETAATTQTTKATTSVAASATTVTPTKKDEKVASKTQKVAAKSSVVEASAASAVVAAPVNQTSLSGQSVVTANETPAPQKKAKTINLSATLMRSSSLNNFQDGSDVQSMDYSFSGSYKLNNLYKVSAGLDASQDLKDESNSDLASGRIGISRKALDISSILTLTPSLGFRIPVNKNQLDRESLIVGTSASARFDIKPEVLFSESFSIGATLSLTKNFHQYTTSTLGSINTEYSSAQGIDIAYSFTEELSISAAFTHSNRLDYEGGMREGFELSQELGYQVTENIGALVGHVNGGSVFKEDGETSNIQAIDEKNSVVYGGMSFTF